MYDLHDEVLDWADLTTDWLQGCWGSRERANHVYDRGIRETLLILRQLDYVLVRESSTYLGRQIGMLRNIPY